jgi:hypothetical protein
MKILRFLSLACALPASMAFGQCIPSAETDISIPFVAVDATDRITFETGLSSFTVYRSRNGAAEAAYTTPTVVETDVTNVPGQYWLLIDEDTTIASGNDFESYVVRITHASMVPVTRELCLSRSKISFGETLIVSAEGDANADVKEWLGTDAATPTAAGVPEVDITYVDGDAAAAVNFEAYTDGTTPQPTNMIQVSGDSAVADRIEAIHDGTCAAYPEHGAIRGIGCSAVSYTHATGVVVIDAAAAFADNALHNTLLMLCGNTSGCQGQIVSTNLLSGDALTLIAPLADNVEGEVLTYSLYATPQTSGILEELGLSSSLDTAITTINNIDDTTGNTANAVDDLSTDIAALPTPEDIVTAIQDSDGVPVTSFKNAAGDTCTLDDGISATAPKMTFTCVVAP